VVYRGGLNQLFEWLLLILFFYLLSTRSHLFFLPASAFYPRLPPKQTLTNKIRVDLPAGRKKRFSLYRRTRGVLRLTGLSPFARKLYLTYDEYFYFYFIPT
jgi:hypothetical protein